MNCTDIQNELVAFVLGELNSADRVNVERHLANGCDECNLQLMAIRESVELLWQTVPNKRLTDDLQQEILIRVLNTAAEAETKTVVAAELGRTGTKSPLIFRWPVQALVAFAAGLMIAVVFQSGGDDRAGQTTIEAQRGRNSESVNLASPSFPGKLELTERQNESTHLVSLRKKANANELQGFVLWDSLASEIHIYCFGLKHPPKDSQYSLWLIGPSIEVRAAERLDVDADGNCKAVVHWPDGEFHFVRVTIEPTSFMNSGPSDNVELTSNALPLFPR